MAALRFYDRVVFSTNARCRAFSVVLAIVAVTLLLLAFDNGPLAGFRYVAGWGMAGGAVYILVRPSIFRGFWRSMFSFVENFEGSTLAARIAEGPIPVDEAQAITKQIAEGLTAAVVVRGVLGVLAGVALIYVGVYVV